MIQEPFVVVGDEAETMVRQRAQDTVKWAVDRLKQDFFPNDPEHILEIWLFKDKTSYEKHTQLLFNDKPTTPFGYYSPAHKALIMNIATGGGTLVHEIVHPFMEANFPSSPSWLNEGLGSLYEQCGEENGHIHGYTNWRLPGLQRAIKADIVPSFKALTGMNATRFLQRRQGHELRSGAIPLLLPATERAAGEVLQRISRESESGPERLRDSAESAGRNKHGPVQEEVGKVCVGSAAGI